MQSRLQTLIDRARDLQAQIEDEVARRRTALEYRVERGRVVFSAEMRARHRAARMRLGAFLAATRPMVVLTAPVIYGLIVPLALLDLAVTLYQWICFPVYRIDRVRRRDFVFLDRHHLAYLNALQKLNCAYCGYATGVIAYLREVAGRTEAFWCPIKHAGRVPDPHARYAAFLDFGDEEEFVTRWAESREKLRKGG